MGGAVRTAHQAVEHMRGISSSRGTSTLSDQRKLATHHEVPSERDFLAYTR